MLYFILLVTSAYAVMWMSIRLFVSGLGKKNAVHDFPDKHLVDSLAEKCNVKIDTVKMNESDLPFGLMGGLPKYPIMVISRNMYDTFNKEELSYVILHEIGHYKYNHILKESFVFLFSYIFCCGILFLVQNSMTWIITIPVLALAIGISNIQIARLFEREADMFAAKHLNNPEAMISATHKFMKAYSNSPRENSWKRKLFYRSVPYSERIQIAENEIKKRK